MKRRRQLMAFMTLAMLLYGRHSCVEWSGPYECTIRTADFAVALTMDSTRLRRQCEWLHRNRYFSSCEIGFGYIKVTINPPVDRSAA